MTEDEERRKNRGGKRRGRSQKKARQEPVQIAQGGAGGQGIGKGEMGRRNGGDEGE